MSDWLIMITAASTPTVEKVPVSRTNQIHWWKQ